MSEEVKDVKKEDVSSEVGKEFAKFLTEKGTVDEKGNTSLTLKNYREFLAGQGITKEILDKQAAVDAEVTNGIYRHGDEVVTKKVEELVKAGKKDEAKEVKTVTSITTPIGTRKVTIQSHKSYPVPGSDKRVDKVLVINDDYKTSRTVSKDMCKGYEDNLKKLLGLE